MSHPTTQSDQGRERSVIEEARTVFDTFGTIGEDEHGRATLVLPGEYGQRLAMLLGAHRTEQKLIDALQSNFADFHHPEDDTAKEGLDLSTAAVDADLDDTYPEGQPESANNGNSDDSRVDVQFTMLKLSGNQAAILEVLAGSGFDALCDNLPGLNTPMGARDDGRPAV